MASSLERDRIKGNVLDRIDELEQKVAELERRLAGSEVGPYTAGAPAAAGYVVLVLYVDGARTTYKLLAAT